MCIRSEVLWNVVHIAFIITQWLILDLNIELFHMILQRRDGNIWIILCVGRWTGIELRRVVTLNVVIFLIIIAEIFPGLQVSKNILPRDMWWSINLARYGLGCASIFIFASSAPFASASPSHASFLLTFQL